MDEGQASTINGLHALSPQRTHVSRPSSRSSFRAGRTPSPGFGLNTSTFGSGGVAEDPVSVRTHISTLKHTIRQHQAQVHDLENIILRGPRPYASDISMDQKISRRNSRDVLIGIAGPDSGLPLPSVIREGIPNNNLNSSQNGRQSESERALSRIPVAAVTNAKVLAADPYSSTSPPRKPAPLDIPATPPSNNTLPSPSRRLSSLTPGGTTKVLADLQTGVINARNALENTKAQLRLSQRSVAQLTRQTEDLKEGRERLRLENEGLNNVVARKERLLQEVLDRARKAETEANTLKVQLKAETTNSKKSVRELEASLADASARTSKSEREYETLRGSIKGLTEGWKADVERLREEMKKRDERWRVEADGWSKKYNALLEEMEQTTKIKTSLEELKQKDREVVSVWTKDIESLRATLEEYGKDGQAVGVTAQGLSDELARLKRLMRAA